MMLRRIARPMLAAWFVTEGVAGYRGAPHHLEPTRTGADALVERLEMTRPTDEQIRTIVKVHGAATAGAGLALALGKAPRVAALVLAALTLPAAVVNIVASRKGAATPAAKAERREHAIRALSFVGAALLAAADREGRPGLAWKVAHARKLAAASAGASVLGAKRTGETAAKASQAVKAATVTAAAAEGKVAAKAAKAAKAAALAEAKAAGRAAQAAKAATLTQAKAATNVTRKGAGAVTAVLGAKAAKAAKQAAQASEASAKPSRSEARAAKVAARADAKAAAFAAKQAAQAEKQAAQAEEQAAQAEKQAARAEKRAAGTETVTTAPTRADAKAAKLAEKDAARAAKAAAAAEADALKAVRTTERAHAKAARRWGRSTESVVTPG